MANPASLPGEKPPREPLAGKVHLVRLDPPRVLQTGAPGSPICFKGPGKAPRGLYPPARRIPSKAKRIGQEKKEKLPCPFA